MLHRAAFINLVMSTALLKLDIISWMCYRNDGTDKNFLESTYIREVSFSAERSGLSSVVNSNPHT